MRCRANEVARLEMAFGFLWGVSRNRASFIVSGCPKHRVFAIEAKVTNQDIPSQPGPQMLSYPVGRKSL